MQKTLLTALITSLSFTAPAGASDIESRGPAPAVSVENGEGRVRLVFETGGEIPDRPVLRLVPLPSGATTPRVGATGKTGTVELGQPMVARGVTLLPVTLSPEVFAAGKKAGSPVAVEILFDEGAAKTSNLRAAAHSRGFFSAYGDLLAGAGKVGGDEEGSFLIITAPQFAAAIEPFAAWKRQMGFETIVATTNETGTGNESIRAWIRNLYDTAENPPLYLVLVGDVEQIPGFDYHQSVTDLPYVLMDGDDFLPDLEVGRFSASTVNHVQTIVAKTVGYEKTPSVSDTTWFRKALLVAGNSSSSTPVPVSRWCREQLYGAGFAKVDTVFYPPHWGTGFPFIKASIDAGVSIVSYRGWAYGWRGWEPPHFTVDEIPSLNNGWKLPLVCSFVCENNNYTFPECFGEAWIRAGSAAAPKGAVAFIGNSEHWSHTRHNDAAAIGTFRAIAERGERRLGQLLLSAKNEIHRSFPDMIYYATHEDNSVEFYYYIYSLLGDPSLELLTERPRELTVNGPDSIALGSNYYWVEVLDGATGDWIEGARVGLSQNGEFLASGFTDEVGEAVFFADFDDDSAPVVVTVTGRGLKARQKTLPVVSNRTHLGIAGVTIYDDGTGSSSGNGDGIVNPGETIAIEAALKNDNAQGTATSVVAFLNAKDLFGTLEAALIDFPNIPAGGTAVAEATWTAVFDGDLEDGFVARFRLSAFTGGTETVNGFSLAVEAPDVMYERHLLDGDGILDPGETSSLAVTVGNEGAADGNGVTAVLRSETRHLAVVTDSIASFGNLPPGAGGTSGSPFTIEATDSAAVGQAAVFTLLLTTDGGYEMTTSFSVRIGDADHRAPLGPDRYGYYAYDNSDTDYPDHAPLFEWKPISSAYGGPGTRLALEDDDSAVLPLGFDFRYYGKTYVEILVSDNGWISFDTEASYDFYNWSLPNLYGPGATVAPFWDNLDPEKKYQGRPVGDGIYFYPDAVNHRFIVEWSRIGNVRPHHENRSDWDELQTFQAILLDPDYYPTPTGDGIIRFQYKHVVNNDYERMYATVGIENEAENDGLEYTYTNMYPAAAAPLSSGLAIDFTTAPPRYRPYDLAAFKAQATDDGLLLSWTPSDGRPRGATVVYRAGGEGPYEALPGAMLPPEATAYLDETADPAKPWSYKIGSFDPVGRETVLGPFVYAGKAEGALLLSLGVTGPNPSRGNSILRYSLPTEGRAKLRIFTVTGRLVRTLVDGEVGAGAWVVDWDGRDDRGRELPSGIYFGRLEVGAERRNAKLTLLR
ncbi:MAG: C25 family cysteine peptidase [Candidatus Eisenbacteria bacterium]